MKLKRVTFVVVLAVALAVILVPVGVLAASGFSVVKSGSNYIVDSVKSEQNIDGVIVQAIERRIIPENRYNPNNPNVPYSSGYGYWDNNGNYINNGSSYNPGNQGNQSNRVPSDKKQRLRDAGYGSSNTLINLASRRGWTYSTRETYSTDSEFDQTLYFRYDNARNYDYVDIEFTQKVYYDQNWNAIVRYFKNGGDNTAYTEADLKAMFDRSY